MVDRYQLTGLVVDDDGPALIRQIRQGCLAMVAGACVSNRHMAALTVRGPWGMSVRIASDGDNLTVEDPAAEWLIPPVGAPPSPEPFPVPWADRLQTLINTIQQQTQKDNTNDRHQTTRRV